MVERGKEEATMVLGGEQPVMLPVIAGWLWTRVLCHQPPSQVSWEQG